ncbi:hypothetical protein PM082_007990 [Marasmius tenuissimus]|nr:hypothetical protein PM082_007990 [Marasmius tenuissimus]
MHPSVSAPLFRCFLCGSKYLQDDVRPKFWSCLAGTVVRGSVPLGYKTRLVPSLRRQDLSANYRSKAATARTLEATLYSNVNDSDDIGWGYLAESDCYQLPSCLQPRWCSNEQVTLETIKCNTREL